MSWFGEFVQNAIFTVFFGILPKDTRIFAKTAFPAVANSECWNAIICQGPSLCPENPQTGIIRTPFLVKRRAVLLKLLSIFQSPGSLECRVLGEVWDSTSVNTPPPSPSSPLHPPFPVRATDLVWWSHFTQWGPQASMELILSRLRFKFGFRFLLERKEIN